MTRILRYVFPLFSIGCLLFALQVAGNAWLMAGVVAMTVAWMAGLALRWKWTAAFGMILVFGTAAYCFLLMRPLFFAGTGQGWLQSLLFTASLSSLIAWDLDGFHSRMMLASPQDDSLDLQRQHLLRLGLASAASLTLMLFFNQLSLELSFEWVVVLMLFMVWGVSRLVNGLLR
jgi:hypothetical protein